MSGLRSARGQTTTEFVMVTGLTVVIATGMVLVMSPTVRATLQAATECIIGDVCSPADTSTGSAFTRSTSWATPDCSFITNPPDSGESGFFGGGDCGWSGLDCKDTVFAFRRPRPAKSTIIVNGIGTTETGEVRDLCGYYFRKPNVNSDVVCVHNPTQGKIKDALETIDIKSGHWNSTVSVVEKQIRDELRSNGNKPIDVIGHSEGGAIVAQAVRNLGASGSLSSDEWRRIRVVLLESPDRRVPSELIEAWRDTPSDIGSQAPRDSDSLGAIALRNLGVTGFNADPVPILSRLDKFGSGYTVPYTDTAWTSCDGLLDCHAGGAALDEYALNYALPTALAAPVPDCSSPRGQVASSDVRIEQLPAVALEQPQQDSRGFWAKLFGIPTARAAENGESAVTTAGGHRAGRMVDPNWPIAEEQYRPARSAATTQSQGAGVGGVGSMPSADNGDLTASLLTAASGSGGSANLGAIGRQVADAGRSVLSFITATFSAIGSGLLEIAGLVMFDEPGVGGIVDVIDAAETVKKAGQVGKDFQSPAWWVPQLDALYESSSTAKSKFDDYARGEFGRSSWAAMTFDEKFKAADIYQGGPFDGVCIQLELKGYLSGYFPLAMQQILK